MNRAEGRIGWPVTVVVIAGAAVVLAGGLLAWFNPGQLLPPNTPIGTGTHLYAARMAARALPLGLALLLLLALRARKMLAGLLVLVAVIEVGDCVSAVVYRDWVELPGALVTVAFIWAASALLGAPCWTARAWRSG